MRLQVVNHLINQHQLPSPFQLHFLHHRDHFCVYEKHDRTLELGLERKHEVVLERNHKEELERNREVELGRTHEVELVRTPAVELHKQHLVDLHRQEEEHHRLHLEVLHRQVGELHTLEEPVVHRNLEAEPVVHRNLEEDRTLVEDTVEDTKDSRKPVLRCYKAHVEEDGQILGTLDAVWNWSEVLWRAERLHVVMLLLLSKDEDGYL